MNKYQKALDILDCHVNSTDVECHHCEKQEKCSSALAIIELQELIDKQDRYRWHDLRKDPKDLPISSKKVLVYRKLDNDYEYAIDTNEHDDVYDVWESDLAGYEVIAWRYMEEFKDE